MKKVAMNIPRLPPMSFFSGVVFGVGGEGVWRSSNRKTVRLFMVGEIGLTKVTS